MLQRLSGVSLIALLLLAVLAVPAFAADAGGDAEGAGEEGEPPPPDFEEVCGRNDVVAEFCPEGYQEPSVFPPILYALLGLGALIAGALFLLYIRWLPHFAQERRAKAKARGRR